MSVPRFLDLADPDFDVTSEAVHAALDESWFAETPYGWAILRYEEGAALLKDGSFRQGNDKWPDQNGIHDGPWCEWWQETLPTSTATTTCGCGACSGRRSAARRSRRRRPRHVVRHPRPARPARIGAALEGRTDYIERVIVDRQPQPRDDLVSTLIAAHEAGDALSRRELSVAGVFLAFAGMETPRNQLGLAVQTFLAHPDQWALLAERPELGARAVEEVMRVNPTVTWVTREAIEDVDLHGLLVPKGGIVQVLSHAIGTDPAAMAEHVPFDISYHDRPLHSGFGGGLHHCLGHFVARTDISVALPRLAQRMPDVAADGPGEWLPVSGNTGPVRFPLRFTPEDGAAR